MPLAHQEPKPKDDPTNTSDHITTNQGGNSGSGLPPVVTVFQPSQPPDGQATPPDKPEKWRKNLTLIFEGIGVIALIVYTVFSILQWAQIRWTNRLTREALDGNNSSLEQTLGRLTWQIQETHEIAKQTLTQATQTTKLATDTHELAGQTKIQAGASSVSAQAATSAAKTAVDTLHIAQRAYVSTGPPSMNFAAGTIHIPLINSGHIPSGLIQIKTFEVTADVRDPSNIRDGTVIEKHWMPTTKQAIQIGQGIGFDFPIRMATAEKIAAGTQYFILAGNITYNDGFPDTLPQHWDFCFQTVYNPKSKTDIIGICEPNSEIPKLTKIIEYPKNEDHSDP